MNDTKNELDHVDDFLDEDEALQLTWRGKTYSIPPVDARTGLRIERVMAAAEQAARDKDAKPDDQVLSDMDELDLYPDVLGPVYDEMLDDGISFRRLKLAATAAMMWTVYDEAVAVEFWEAGGKAPAPANRQQRRAETTRTGGASTTKRPASGSGTSTRRKPSDRQRKATD